jgi:hypothetical protein
LIKRTAVRETLSWAFNPFAPLLDCNRAMCQLHRLLGERVILLRSLIQPSRTADLQRTDNRWSHRSDPELCALRIRTCCSDGYLCRRYGGTRSLTPRRSCEPGFTRTACCYVSYADDRVRGRHLQRRRRNNALETNVRSKDLNAQLRYPLVTPSEYRTCSSGTAGVLACSCRHSS